MVLVNEGHTAPFAVALMRKSAVPPAATVASTRSIVSVGLVAVLLLVTG